MNVWDKAVALILAATFLAPSLAAAAAADTGSSVGVVDLDRALQQRVGDEQQAYASVRRLLARPGVAELAREVGLDLRRAESALATLGSEELRDLAERARLVDGELAGGKTVTISLVAALLIIIIVILLAD